MAFARVYTDPDGKTHIEDIELPLTLIRHHMRSELFSAKDIRFLVLTEGVHNDLHTERERGYLIFFSGGQMEVGLADGTVRRFGPGDAVRYEDMTGEGHTSRVVGGNLWAARVNLPD
jgi:hypothetical protein